MHDHTDPVTGLVGRGTELAQLQRLLDQARAGVGRTLLVDGPAGIGKSTLVATFLDDHRGDATVLAAVGLRWEQDEPFAALAQLLAGHDGDDVVSLRRLLATDAPPVRIGQLLAEVLTRLAQKRPCLLLLDDAQWADDPSLQALSTAMRRLGTAPVFAILVTSDDPDGRPEQGVVRLAPFVDLALTPAPLQGHEVLELARRMGVRLTAFAASTVAEHCGGNPGLARQLLLDHEPDYWLTRDSELATTQSALRDVQNRLSGLSPAARRLAEAACVLGRRAPLAQAAALAGLDDAVPAFDDLHRGGLIALEGTTGVSTIVIRDPMTRAALYAATGPLRRRELHLAAARLLDDVAEALRHRAAALPGQDDEVADLLAGAAAEQAHLGEWSRASRTLLLASRLSRSERVAGERLLLAVEGMVGSGDLVRATDYVPQIETLPPSALRSTVLGYLAVGRGRAEEADRYLSAAWAQAGEGSDPAAPYVTKHRVLDSLTRWSGADLVEWSRRSRTAQEVTGSSAVESLAMTGLGLSMQGHLDEARDLYERVLEESGTSAQWQRVQLGRGWVDLAADRLAEARQSLEAAAPTVQRGGSARIASWAQGWLARVQFAYGDWDEALATVRDGLLAIDRVGLDLIVPLVHWTGVQIHCARGDVAAAEAHLHGIDRRPNEYLVMEVPARIAHAQFSEACGDHDGVARALEPLTAYPVAHCLNEPGFWPWADLYAEALVAIGRHEEADRFLRPREALASARGHRTATAALARARARLLAATGDVPGALAALTTGLDALGGLPTGYQRARLQLVHGQVLRRAGKRREADHVLTEARQRFAALAAEVEVARCDAELRISGARPRRDARDMEGLTAQEQAVAGLVAQGRSNREVAAELYLSVKTVQFHLTRIYAKVGVRSRTELTVRLAEREP